MLVCSFSLSLECVLSFLSLSHPFFPFSLLSHVLLWLTGFGHWYNHSIHRWWHNPMARWGLPWLPIWAKTMRALCFPPLFVFLCTNMPSCLSPCIFGRVKERVNQNVPEENSSTRNSVESSCIHILHKAHHWLFYLNSCPPGTFIFEVKALIMKKKKNVNQKNLSYGLASADTCTLTHNQYLSSILVDIFQFII